MSKAVRIILVLSLIGNLCIVYVAYKALEYREHINEFLDKYTYVVDEFSGRDNYAVENNDLRLAEIKADRVVFLGSQITRGWDLDRYFQSYEAINRGIIGQRFSGFLLRFKPDVLDLKPAAVVIEFSSYNFRPENSVEEFQDYTTCLADLARSNGIQPILCTVMPVRSDFDVEMEIPYSVNDSLSRYNDWLRNYCQEQNLGFVDFYDLLADDEGYLLEEFSSGQILLNQDGYELVSEATEEALGR